MSVAIATTASTNNSTNSNIVDGLEDSERNMPPKDHVIDFTHRESVEDLLTKASRDDDRHRMKDGDLFQLRKLAGNATCIDCGAQDPIWASVNLGIFVCLSCSGSHR